jgi:hypothetical protein
LPTIKKLILTEISYYNAAYMPKSAEGTEGKDVEMGA